MSRFRNRVREATHGRTVRRGLTLKSAAITIGVIVLAVFAVGLLVRQFQEEFAMEARVVDHRIVDTESGCAWEIEFTVINNSDRPMSLTSAELDGVAGSDRSLAGSIDPAGSIDRVFRHPVADCSSVDADTLIVRYSPALSTIERTVSATID